MLFLHKELKIKYGSDYKIKLAIKNGEIIQLENGLYSDKKVVSNLEIVSKKYPNAIINSLSAYFYQGLLEKKPNKIYLATLRDSSKIKDENIIQTFTSSNLFYIGESSISYDNVDLKIYNKERLLIELIRNKNNLPKNIYSSILDNYKNMLNQGLISLMTLEDYVLLFPNSKMIIEELKNIGINLEINTYKEYKIRINNGETFTKEDLDYDTLYKMAIEENTIDTMIGEIFNMNKGQVRTLREKWNLGNVFMRRQVDNIENVIKQIPNEENLSELELYTIYIKTIKIYCESKGWRYDVVLSYLMEKSETLPELKLALKELGYEINEQYKVNFKNLEHIGTNVPMVKKNNFGKKINQLESTKSKIKSGNLGEAIAYDAEIQKLHSLGLDNLIEDVRLITKTSNLEESYDGLGYDLISFNEKQEKIYIEVKCSTTNKNQISFNITRNEVEFINGKLKDKDTNKNIDKDHAFIYYIHNIDKRNLTADILIITSETFNKYELKPEVYSINEEYKEVENVF